MSNVDAWLMQIDDFSRVAIGQLELIHIIASPEYIEVPKAPEYCQRVIVWNDEIIPVIDISILMDHAIPCFHQNAIAVVIYHDENNQVLKYGGIQLFDTPVLAKVSNTQAVIRADMQDRWEAVALSCFKDEEDELIPVLDLKRLFSSGVDKFIGQSF